MQLVLNDSSIFVGAGTVRTITVDQGLISRNLSAYNKGRESTEVDRVRNKLISDIKTEEDSEGSSSILIKIKEKGAGLVKIKVIPSVPDKSIFKRLVQKFQENVRISVYLKWHFRIDLSWWNSATMEGMKIDPVTFACAGYLEGTAAYRAIPEPPLQNIHVKLVAEIDGAVAANTYKPILFAQTILEKGTCSDLIISAGNGAKVKAHRAFLCVCSPVFEKMLGSGTEETRSGQVDMSDLSEAGVKAFLRYAYHGDLKEPHENTQVAYELFYAGHNYDVPGLKAEMRRLLMDSKSDDIGLELAFKIFMFTKTIETAVELKNKALEILNGFDSGRCGGINLESGVETFLGETIYENLDVAVAFQIYVFTRNIQSATELKNKALRVLTAKWDELESLQEYNSFFEKPSNSKTIKELCKDLAKAANMNGS